MLHKVQVEVFTLDETGKPPKMSTDRLMDTEDTAHTYIIYNV